MIFSYYFNSCRICNDVTSFILDIGDLCIFFLIFFSAFAFIDFSFFFLSYYLDFHFDIYFFLSSAFITINLLFFSLAF